MLTPRFEITQTDADLTLTIYAPYANVAETEIFVEEEHFRFFSPPYYLRLHLPGCVEETDASTGCYDADEGKFVVCIAKVTKGEHFPDLDLLTTLLAPRKTKPVVGRAGIEVLGEQCVDDDDDNSEWFLEQPLEAPLADLTGEATYGFAGHSKGVFSRFQGELAEILDLPDPDSTPACDRWRLQVEREKKDFCEMHYLADLMEPEAIEALLEYQPTLDEQQPLSESLQSTLLKLSNREYLLSSSEKRCAYLGLVDVLFAYCYDRRVTEGEPSSESAWNVNKLSATLCWMQSFANVEAVVLSCFRRSLVYPLFRSWDLSLAVLHDTVAILRAGKKEVLRCFLDIHNLFNLSELRYLLNRLYIQDYCIWVQQCSPSKLVSIATAITQCIPHKHDLDLDLVELEAAAILVEEEEKEMEGKAAHDAAVDDQVACSLEKLSLVEGVKTPEQHEEDQDACTVEKRSLVEGEKTPAQHKKVEEIATQLDSLRLVEPSDDSKLSPTFMRSQRKEDSDSGSSSYDSESDSETESDSESDGDTDSSTHSSAEPLRQPTPTDGENLEQLDSTT